MADKEYKVPQHLITFFKERAKYIEKKRKQDGLKKPNYPQENE
jgi:hypothetical protein